MVAPALLRAVVPLGRADQGQPLRRGFKALRNTLGKAAALLQVVQLVGARDGAEAAGAEAHAAVAAERLVDDGHGGGRRERAVGAHLLAGPASTAQATVYDVVGLAHRLSFAPRCGCRRLAPNRVDAMSQDVPLGRRCQCSRSHAWFSTGQQRMKVDAAASAVVRYACSAAAPRGLSKGLERMQRWKIPWSQVCSWRLLCHFWETRWARRSCSSRALISSSARSKAVA